MGSAQLLGIVVGGGEAEAHRAALVEVELRELDRAGAGPDAALGLGGLEGHRLLVLSVLAGDLDADAGEAEVVRNPVLERNRAERRKLHRERLRSEELYLGSGVLDDLDGGEFDLVGEAVVVRELDSPLSPHVLEVEPEREASVVLGRRLDRPVAGEEELFPEVRPVGFRGNLDLRPRDGGDRGGLLLPDDFRLALRVCGIPELHLEIGVRWRSEGLDLELAREGAPAVDAVGEGLLDERIAERVVGRTAPALRGGLGHALRGLAPRLHAARPHVRTGRIAGLHGELHGERGALQDHGVAGRDLEGVRIDVVHLCGRDDGADYESRHRAREREDEERDDRYGYERREEARLDGAGGEVLPDRDLPDVCDGVLREDLHEAGGRPELLSHAEEFDDRREALLELGMVRLDESRDAGGGQRNRKRLDDGPPGGDDGCRDDREPESPMDERGEDDDHRVDGHDDEYRHREDGDCRAESADEDDAPDAAGGRLELRGYLLRQLRVRGGGDPLGDELRTRSVEKSGQEFHLQPPTRAWRASLLSTPR